MNTAMILCAGFGARMKDYTRDIPKPMLPVSGKPMLEYSIRHLSGLGIKNIVINLHYLPDKITSYFEDGKKWGVKITYSHEDTPLGTAGAVKKAGDILSVTGNFLVLHGDVVCFEDYLEMLKFHESRPDAVGTIVLHQRDRSNSVVEMDGENRITRFIERPEKEVKDKKQNWVNSSLYCFSKEIFKYINSGGFCDFPGDVFPGMVKKGVLYGYPLTAYRCSVDSPQRYSSVQADSGKGLLKNEKL